MPLSKKPKASVNKRLLSKSLAMRLEERLEEEEVPEPQIKTRTPSPPKPPPSPPRETAPIVRRTERTERSRVVILDKPREAMRGQILPISVHGFPTLKMTPVRMGVEREAGSIFHCIIKASWPPYANWNREKRITRIREFRRDLTKAFEGYYMRMDQRGEKWGPLYACKRELEFSEGVFRHEFLDFIGKLINKNFCMTEIDMGGNLRFVPGSRVYGKSSQTSRSSPPTMLSRSLTQSPGSSEPPMFVIILHLGRGAYELVGMVKNDTSEAFTLFPEDHLLCSLLMKK